MGELEFGESDDRRPEQRDVITVSGHVKTRGP